jgi:nucleotide-binding universal stress UspA family protein
MLVDTIIPAKNQIEDELWVSMNEWTILKQSPPNILVVDSGKGSLNTLGLALQFVKAMNGKLSVLGWTDELTDESRMNFKNRIADANLSNAELHLRSGKLVEQIEVHRSGALFELIILPRRINKKNKSLDAALTVCLENADIPVLIAGESLTWPVRRMLVCTRAGEPGKNDIRYGGRLARYFRSEISLLHVTPETGSLSPRIEKHLQLGAASLAQLGIKSEALIRSGQPVPEILIEEKKHDLVVIGGHGPTFRSIIGADDITMQIINHSQKPILIIPNE